MNFKILRIVGVLVSSGRGEMKAAAAAVILAVVVFSVGLCLAFFPVTRVAEVIHKIFDVGRGSRYGSYEDGTVA